jgi:hypothetical protein
MRRRQFQAALGLSLAGPAWSLAAEPAAVELAGVRYAGSEQVAGQHLLLNGAGIRFKAIFKVYTAGLYLAAPATTPEAVYAAPGAKRMHIVMLRDIDANELGRLFTRGMEKNAPLEEFSKSIPGTLRLAELFARRKRLGPGDSWTVDWVPGTGTVVVVNGKAEIEPIKEPEFFRALLSIWLGRSPADNLLKDALLGRKSDQRSAYG